LRCWIGQSAEQSSVDFKNARSEDLGKFPKIPEKILELKHFLNTKHDKKKIQPLIVFKTKILVLHYRTDLQIPLDIILSLEGYNLKDRFDQSHNTGRLKTPDLILSEVGTLAPKL